MNRVEVIDVGCATHGTVSSLDLLRWRFKPDVLHGFDPWPHEYRAHATHLYKAAAWTFDGHVRYVEEGTRSHLSGNGAGYDVPCIDLGRFILGLPADSTVVLKLDAEGAEYQLLEHLVDLGADRRLSLLLVEWHPPYEARDAMQERIGCPVEEWTW